MYSCWGAQGLDIALREQPVGLYSPVGPSFFSESFGSCELGGGVAGWRGFYQSVRPTQQGLVLNVDVSASGFHRRMPVLQFAQQLFNKPQGFNPSNSFSDHERVKLRRAITRLQVNVTHRDTPRRCVLRHEEALKVSRKSGSCQSFLANPA